VSTGVDLARRQWEEGHRRFGDLTRNGSRPELLAQLDSVVAELRRRLGGVFSLRELAGIYPDAERWAYETLSASGAPGWAASATTVIDAAFLVYARSARDYTP
jgi:hypothetical protein